MLTERDQTKVDYLLSLASNHASGGRYNMVAAWVKGKRMLIGYNRLDRPAATFVDIYPDICGVHAELDLYFQAKNAEVELRGGTIYIVGRKSANDNTMLNTMPCDYCKAIFESTKIRNMIFLSDGEPRKRDVSQIWGI